MELVYLKRCPGDFSATLEMTCSTRGGCTHSPLCHTEQRAGRVGVKPSVCARCRGISSRQRRTNCGKKVSEREHGSFLRFGFAFGRNDSKPRGRTRTLFPHPFVIPSSAPGRVGVKPSVCARCRGISSRQRRTSCGKSVSEREHGRFLGYARNDILYPWGREERTPDKEMRSLSARAKTELCREIFCVQRRAGRGGRVSSRREHTQTYVTEGERKPDIEIRSLSTRTKTKLCREIFCVQRRAGRGARAFPTGSLLRRK